MLFAGQQQTVVDSSNRGTSEWAIVAVDIAENCQVSVALDYYELIEKSSGEEKYIFSQLKTIRIFGKRKKKKIRRQPSI